MSEMVHMHRFECHGRNKEFVPLDEYRILRDERDRLARLIEQTIPVVEAALDREMVRGSMANSHVLAHVVGELKAALTPAAGGTRHG